MNFIPSNYFTLPGLGAWAVWSKTRYRNCKIFSKQNHKLISRHTNKLFADRLRAYLREFIFKWRKARRATTHMDMSARLAKELCLSLLCSSSRSLRASSSCASLFLSTKPGML